MRRRISLRLIIMWILVFATACVGNDDGDSGDGNGGQIRAGYQIGLYMGAYYVAVEKGFFEEEGLTDIEHMEFSSGPVEAQAVAAGEIEVAFGMGVVPGINARAQGIPLVFLGNFSASGESLLLRQDLVEEIDPTDAEDVRGLTIAIPAKGNQQDFLARVWLRDLGLDPDRDVEIVFLPFGSPQGAALERGSIDVAVSAEPFSSAQEEQGLGTVFLTGQDIAPDHDASNIAVTEEWLDENRDQATAIVRALARAVEWVHDNSEEYYDIVSERTAVDAATIRDVFEEGRIVVPDSLEPDTNFYFDVADFLLRENYVDEDATSHVDAYLCCYEEYLQEVDVGDS